MAKVKILPPLEELQNKFYYNDGVLYRKRLESDDGFLNGQNKRWADKPAGVFNKKRGYLITSLTINGKKLRFYNHRLIWELCGGDKLDELDKIDHINGDKLDNRFENLRKCSNAENSKNSGKRTNNTSGFKNVSFHKAYGKYESYCMVMYKKHSFGFYDTAEEAFSEYLKGIALLHGEFTNSDNLRLTSRW